MMEMYQHNMVAKNSDFRTGLRFKFQFLLICCVTISKLNQLTFINLICKMRRIAVLV